MLGDSRFQPIGRRLDWTRSGVSGRWMGKCSIIPIIANSILNGGCQITPRFVGANGLESLQFFFFFFCVVCSPSCSTTTPLRPSNLKRIYFMAFFCERILRTIIFNYKILVAKKRSNIAIKYINFHSFHSKSKTQVNAPTRRLRIYSPHTPPNELQCSA